MLRFSYDEKAAVTPDYVAEKMLDLIVKGEYGSGSCLEVTKTSTSLLGTWNIPPPALDLTDLPEEFRNTLYAPYIAMIEKEKQPRV